MARWDQLTIRRYGISGKTLMQRAAEACFQVLKERETKLATKNFVILCGPGNNGGDGFALGGLLQLAGAQVDCFYLGKAEKYSPEAQEFLEALDPPAISLKNKKFPPSLGRAFKKAHWLIDALFGTGLSRKVTGTAAQLIERANGLSARKLAVDMPSGVSGETGRVLGRAFRADLTVTFEAPKWGQVQSSAWELVGDLEVRSIGLAPQVEKKLKSPGQWLTSEDIKKFLKKRPKDMNKGKAGAALIVAGSPQMPGAGALTGLGALRSGAGLVTWALPEPIQKRLYFKFPELILKFVSASPQGFNLDSAEEIKGMKSRFKAMALGPGWGQSESTFNFFKKVLPIKGISKVIDADALNLLAKDPYLKKQLKRCILTPHPKEMSRLLQCSVAEVLKNRVAVAQAFAKKYGVHLILKSYQSVAVNPKGEVWINSTGGPNLAVAGSGDVLTGILTGLLAQGLKLQEAMLAGMYLHGRAGDRLAGRLGDRGTLASDVAREVPKVIGELL